MKNYAIDFESFYDKECSIKVQGVWGYLRHPKADIYLVSVVGDDGYEWVGHPRDFDWTLIEGHRWLAHNMQFDMAVVERCKELGYIPTSIEPGDWACTADLSAYHGLPRNLKGAVESCLPGVAVSKDTRDAMAGKRWEDMPDDFREEVSKYALHDSRCCLQIWQKLGPRWPHIEKVISQSTALMTWNGLPVNPVKIENAIATLKDQIWEAEGKIPWHGTEKTLSPKALAEECRKVGIEPPRSLAQDSEECAEWEDKYSAKYPWVDAMRTVRRCNALMKKFEAMRNRTRPDGRMDAGLLYCGAHTLRDSGSGGVNLQNMPKEEMFETNMRECIEAPPGRTFVVSDLSQIEPRVIAWLAGDDDFIKLLATGLGPYEAHARSSMGWTGGELKKEDPSMYALAKARVLALGYGAGWEKFITMARNYVNDAAFANIFENHQPSEKERADFITYLRSQERRRPGKLAKFHASEEKDQWTAINAYCQVMDYRKSNKKITDFWERLDKTFRACIGKDCQIDLPSGRTMTYRAIQNLGSLSCKQVRNGSWTRTKIYGGLAAENITQSLARDVFMDCVYRILKAGHQVILRVHDEVVIECDEDKAEQVLAEVTAIMHTAPTWFPSLPLASDGMISKVYKK